MALGPGRYDDLCTDVRERTAAAGVILIVIDGNRGEGFAAQLPPALLLALPQILRNVADQIEDDRRVALDDIAPPN